MKPTRTVVFRLLIVCLLLIVCGAVASLLPDRGTKQRRGAFREMTERKMPPALGRHLEKLAQAVPGLGENRSGQERRSRGVPGDGLPGPTSRWRGLRPRARPRRGSRARSSPRARAARATWVTVGPSKALYPVTSSAIRSATSPTTTWPAAAPTAIAIDPNCAPGNCRLWVFAAGGGVWRTKNALNGQPNWQFLSGDFGIKSGSSITLDPNDAERQHALRRHR